MSSDIVVKGAVIEADSVTILAEEGGDLFLAKLDSNLNVVWNSKKISGAGLDS